jgi:hypothetical protein
VRQADEVELVVDIGGENGKRQEIESGGIGTERSEMDRSEDGV